MSWSSAAAISSLLLLGVAPPAQVVTESDGCDIQSFEVTWGLKESFRSYLSSTIANGDWEVSGGVSYETPLFTFGGETGMVTPDVSEGELVSTGSIRFTGHDGLLDQTLSVPRITFRGGDVFVTFDVSGDTQEGVSVDKLSVPFVALDTSSAVVNSELGSWSVTKAPTTLTEEGAAAFGTYPAGEAFDPIDIRFQTTPGCLDEPVSSGVFLGLGLGSAVTVSLAIFLVRRLRERGPRGRAESSAQSPE